MTIKEIAAEYGISDSTARRKMGSIEPKGYKGFGVNKSADYAVVVVRTIFGKKKKASA